MDIVAAGPGDEALLLDLLNSTPSSTAWLATNSRIRSQHKPGWIPTTSARQTNSSYRTSSTSGLHCRTWCARTGRRRRWRRSSAESACPRSQRRGPHLVTDHPRDVAGRGAGITGLGCVADRQSRTPSPVRQRRMPAVSDRSQQAQHRTVVLDGHLRQPHEGTSALPAD